MMKKKSDKELIREAKDLHTALYIVECYSANDLPRYLSIIAQLEKRGYVVEETRSLHIGRISVRGTV